MQEIILAGGYGTPLSEEMDLIPMPMVRIGGFPKLEHVMNFYSKYEHSDFIVALGYNAGVVRDYFGTAKNSDWKESLVDTELETSTGRRLKKLENVLDDEFMITCGHLA